MPYLQVHTLQDNAQATGAGTEVWLDGAAVATFDVKLGGTATVTFQGTGQSGTYVAIPATNLTTGATATTATASGLYRVDVSGLQRVRANVTAWSSGGVWVWGTFSDEATNLPVIGGAVPVNNTTAISGLLLPEVRALVEVRDNNGDINTSVVSGRQIGGQITAAATAIGMVADAVGYGFDGTNAQALRTPTVFKVVALTAATAETTIWTPTSGKKFRLMGFLLTTGAASTLTFKDNTAGTTIFAARAATDTPIHCPPLGNGILSAAANNVLTVTRGTSATLDGVVFGTEE